MSGRPPLRICLLVETFFPEIGGGETQARLFAETMVERGHEVTVVTRRSRSTLPSRERCFGANVLRLPPSGSGHLRKWGLLMTVPPVIGWIGRRYDVLVVLGFRILGLPAVLVGGVFRRPSILKADSTGELSGEFFHAGLSAVGVSHGNKLFRLFIASRNCILRRASAFVALSSAMEREFRQEGVEPSKIHRIPNCVDTGWFRPASVEERKQVRRELGFPSGTFVLTYTGRLVTYKGLPLLLKVWREASARHPEARLLLVGSGGSDIHNCEAQLKRYVRDNHLSRSVLFAGSVEDVHRYLWASDGFVFPTEDEAFGVSLIEAMACGLPCITTSVGGVIDIVEDENVALVVEPASHDQLLRAIDLLLTDSSLAAQLGDAATRRVRDAYGRDSVGRRYDELISACVEQR